MQLIDIHSNRINLKRYSSVTDNSKDVVPEGIFVAIQGKLYDGHDYVNDAVKNGASLIIIDKSKKDIGKKILNTPVVIVDDSRIALSYVASHIYSDKPENIIAITGTNGKTSVTYFFQQLCSMLGIKAASIGTLGVISDSKKVKGLDSTLTTPGALQLHKILYALKNKGINHVALEASSHGLIQHRMDYVAFKGAGFTSFSREHLDYHKDMQSYLKAKLYLFENLLDKGSFALINNEMKIKNLLLEVCKSRNIEGYSYGNNGSFINIKSITYIEKGFDVRFFLNNCEHHFICNLFGKFQVYNILCCLGILVSLGFDIEKVLPIIENLSNIPGRMQRVGSSNVYVDHSHTPDAISNALRSMKEFLKSSKKKGKIIIVFGCGGDRDKGKRPEMGKVASNLADVVIVTDDNPRTEDPSTIRKGILKSCPDAINIGGREKAIKYAIQNSKSDDLILIAGKGHEKFQIVFDKKIAFDDVEIAEKYL
ncbi:MAG: UDP-N-acetylmuramoyl-L-alanyl-D-glutamate--2,6-diaminopimelate ligase [Rickettsiales bacterium]|nr:UDP-N-acetylmuramoyl-L-alanyl-D-glutamate--2,6-diaminopimelate ligase [Rickettsiales bacterium]